MFRKGDYIVTLVDDGSCGKKNYCSKQRQDHDSLAPEIDTQGLKANSNHTFNYKDQTGTEWRYATKEEAVQYEVIGKPYDVTTLNPPERKNELVMKHGDFYYIEWSNMLHYIVCKGINNKGGDYCICVEQRNSYSYNSCFDAPPCIRNIRAATEEERKWLVACIGAGKWVPKQEIEVGTWVTVLSDANTSNDGLLMRGKTFQVTDITEGDLGSSTCYVDGYQELLEEGRQSKGIWVRELRPATQQEIKNVVGKVRKKTDLNIEALTFMNGIQQYKKGDIVICIKATEGNGVAGFGWQEGLVFTVSQISPSVNGRQILFGGLNGDGVFNDHVRPALFSERHGLRVVTDFQGAEKAVLSNLNRRIKASIQATQTGRMVTKPKNSKVKLQKLIERNHKTKRIRRREVL